VTLRRGLCCADGKPDHRPTIRGRAHPMHRLPASSGLEPGGRRCCCALRLLAAGLLRLEGWVQVEGGGAHQCANGCAYDAPILKAVRRPSCVTTSFDATQSIAAAGLLIPMDFKDWRGLQPDFWRKHFANPGYPFIGKAHLCAYGFTAPAHISHPA
jgi:hypothetical protein